MLDLFKAIGLGLVVLLPLANPLTTVALFLGLAGNMNSAERNSPCWKKINCYPMSRTLC